MFFSLAAVELGNFVLVTEARSVPFGGNPLSIHEVDAAELGGFFLVVEIDLELTLYLRPCDNSRFDTFL